MGGEASTFAGLTGLGDLVATCVSQHSRNRYVGEQLGTGRSLDDILDEMNMVAEGVKTAGSVMTLRGTSRHRSADLSRGASCGAGRDLGFGGLPRVALAGWPRGRTRLSGTARGVGRRTTSPSSDPTGYSGVQRPRTAHTSRAAHESSVSSCVGGRRNGCAEGGHHAVAERRIDGASGAKPRQRGTCRARRAVRPRHPRRRDAVRSRWPRRGTDRCRRCRSRPAATR